MALTKAPAELLNLDSGITITTADNTDQLTLLSTDADASQGPSMAFYRNSSSPADSDDMGNIFFYGENDNDEKIEYGRIRSIMLDASDGTEDSNIRFWTMAAGTLTDNLALAGGKVGIGVSAPAEMLEIYNATSPAIQLNDGGDYQAIARLAGNDLEIRGSSGNIEFYTGNADGDSSTERMRIDSSGRVLIGLGTADTLYGGVVPTLQVEGTGAHDSAIGIFRNSNDGSGPTLSMGKSRGTADNSDTIVQSGDYTGTIAFTGADGGERMRATAAIKSSVDGTPGDNDMPGRLTFWTTPDGAYDEVERVRIDSDGKVGIGGASDGDDLHVKNGSTSCNVRISGEGNINRKAQIGYDASAGPYVQAGSSGINTLKFFVDNTSLAMTIAANDVISGDFNDTSDVALKENIVDLESATEKLKQLKPRIFDWKNPDKEKGVGGFIAQEVETVIPKAVVGNDYVADTYYADGDTIPAGKEIGDIKTAGDPGKAVNTSAILAYAVKAIQELEAKVKALEEA